MRLKSFVPALLVAVSLLVAACERPPVDSTQSGYRGTGMADIRNPRATADALRNADAFPAPLPPAPATGPKAGDVYQNVQVLGDLSVAEFTRLMTAITAWVSPQDGCNYCHNPANLASDDIYTKVVSRRMLEMTRHINSNWDEHVGATGVNCYTCHRGKNVPEYIWFDEVAGQSAMATYAGNRKNQNAPAPSVALASLPTNALTTYFTDPAAVRARVVSTEMHPGEVPVSTIQQTEDVYGLMMHMSESLDVNCTFCHNTASFQSWEASNPQRATAYHGIEMVRSLNRSFLLPLAGEYPEERLGEAGDAPKASCLTCHQGQNKPLAGAPAVDAYPALSP